MGILKLAESGVPVFELCSERGMSSASFYKWRAKFGGMDASLMSLLNRSIVLCLMAVSLGGPTAAGTKDRHSRLGQH